MFDGIGGRLALERAGFKINNYYASEVEPNAIKICQANWSDVTEIGDVRLIHGENYANIDLLCGGSPCQNFSFAGTRKGAVTKDNVEVTTLEQYLELKNKDLNLKDRVTYFGNMSEYSKRLNLNIFY